MGSRGSTQDHVWKTLFIYLLGSSSALSSQFNVHGNRCVMSKMEDSALG